MKMIRSLTTGGQLFEIQPKFVLQLVPAQGLTELFPLGGE